MKYLIVGGVAGGASTAARLRRLDEHAEIILFERGEYISYANCGLPYYIGNVITERDKLFVQTPQTFGKRFDIDVRVNSNVKEVNANDKTITVYNSAEKREYTESYDKLILSPGAEPVRPPLPGIDLPGIFTLRNVRDTDIIKAQVDRAGISRAVVVGAGFIGLEMAENLHHKGLEVTIVEMADQVMTPVDYEIAAVVHQHIKSKNVGLRLNQAVNSFEQHGNALKVVLKSGESFETDMVILSIGVRPDVTLAKSAGLKLGPLGGIWVNEYMQTSDEYIYAVGDAIEFPHPLTGDSSFSYLAGPANKQGRICADNLVMGNKRSYKGAINTGIAKVFDLTVGSTGLSARMLERIGLAFQTAIVHAGSHAGYYPGAIPLTIKINFSPEDGKLLGGQVVGYTGVDKRLDMLATVVKNGGSIEDLVELEHAYAPPFSSAKDPVNMAGFVAENILSGVMKPISWRELNDMGRDSFTLIDVRTKHESQLATIEGAVNYPVDELRDHLNHIPKDKPVVVFCAVGLRGHVASRILVQHGFQRVFNLIGGFKTYEVVTAEQNHTLVSQIVEEDLDEMNTFDNNKNTKTISIDACGLQCPGPVMKLKAGMDQINPGDKLEITSTDQGFLRDVESWSHMTGNKLLTVENHKGVVKATIEKGVSKSPAMGGAGPRPENKTIIVFSDDLDKALASFVIANGAASTGRKVTMFFTFWGLSVIKKEKPGNVDKTIIGRMFGMMLPKNSKALTLSKMNMGGIGSKMMRWVMKREKIDSLESLMAQAEANGIEMIACQMSMDVMGVKREELLDSVQIGGVATYLERAEDANVNLFI